MNREGDFLPESELGKGNKGIKALKPNARSRYTQGYYDVTNSTKYAGEPPCIFRSGLELQTFNMFENSPDVVKWCSEPQSIYIKYFFDGKWRRYYIDAWCQKDGEKDIIIEIKPFSQCQKPKKGSEWETKNYEKNVAKWKAAYEYAKENNMIFMIITERFFKSGKRI